MQFEFLVTVDVERVSGKFASRDEISEQIQDELERAEMGEISGVGADGTSEYEITEWQVEGK